MSHQTTSRTGWRMAITAGILAVLAGCGAEVASPPQDIGRVADVTETDVAVPTTSSRNCSYSLLQARAERVSVCAE